MKKQRKTVLSATACFALCASRCFADTADTSAIVSRSVAIKKLGTTVFMEAEGRVTSFDILSRVLTIVADGKSYRFLVAPKFSARTEERGLDAADVRVGDNVHMFQRESVPLNKREYWWGLVTSTAPLTFGFTVVTSWVRKEGRELLGDFATMDNSKPEQADLYFVGWMETAFYSPHLYQQTRTFTVLKPEKVQFTRFGTAKLEDVAASQTVFVAAEFNADDEFEARNVSIIYTKAKPGAVP